MALAENKLREEIRASNRNADIQPEVLQVLWWNIRI